MARRTGATSTSGQASDGSGTSTVPDEAAPQARNPFRRVWWLPVVRGVLLVVLGLLLMIEPLGDLDVMRLVLGAFLVVDGVLAAVQWFAHRKQLSSAWWLVQAAVNVVFGVVVAFWPDVTPTVLYYLLAVWVLVLGIVAIVGAAGLARNRDLGAAWMLTSGITSALFGLLLVTRPLDSFDVLRLVAIVFALYAFVAGAIHVVSGFAVRAAARELADLRAQAEAAGVVVSGGSVLGAAAARPDVVPPTARPAPAPAVVDPEPTGAPVQGGTPAPDVAPEVDPSADPEAVHEAAQEDTPASGDGPGSTGVQPPR
ncbi:DUF308 domain-containing protein [Cellulosimicrobium terreum]|nr:DUF308 domain-containing protein [Cellulosimicrobium terreum]